ncbi:MAG TPA: catalase family peroxidase [Nevskiaceae bacterium]|nr:catalase family peroxidase [Nevskiaceae bacterium]
MRILLRPWLCAASLLLALPAPGARAQDLATEIVDAMNGLFGRHAGERANHAKGVVAEGSFTGAPGAAALSRAAIFQGQPVPVVVRFSNATGLPDIADGAPEANPRGISIKLKPAGGGEVDLVLNSLKFFPVADGERFRDLLRARLASRQSTQKPTPMEQFLAAHPGVARAMATLATPASFAEERYFGINAFVLVNAAGEKQAVRYQLLPPTVRHLPPEEAARQPANYLVEELGSRLARGPVSFTLKAQLAAPGDPTHDPSQPWPDERPLVTLGTLRLDRAVADSRAAARPLLFLPTNLQPGIELSDDPMPALRTAAYAVSFSRRQ